ncbi:MAG: AMP-binding protein [Burkholderiales bacterium]
MKTAVELLWQSAARLPDHLALAEDGGERRLTYGELTAEIETLAAGLSALGVRPGDRFATVMPGSLDLILTLFALSRIGAIPALINPRLKPEEVGKLLAQGGMKGALIGSGVAAVDAAAKALPAGTLLLVPGAGTGVAQGLATCRGDARSLERPPRPAEDDPAYIFYTSGTTGLPKAVLIPHRATEARLVNTVAITHVRFGTHNRFLGFMPLNHAIGFYGVLIPCLVFNGTYFAQNAFEPDRALAGIERYRINYLFATPTHYHLMLESPSFGSRDLSSLDMLCYGAAPAPFELLQRMAKGFKSRLCHVYGTTETMCSLYEPAPLENPDRLSAGYLSAMKVVRVGGGTGDAVAPGEEGELLVDATVGTTFTAYLDRPDVTAEKLVDGWYRTGDIARLNDDGSVTLKGRKDDIIRSGAENVHPAEVEATLASHPGVADVAAVGIPDVRWGELVVACVVCRTPAPSAQELDAHCRNSTLADYKRPRAYFSVAALPRNAANKVLRHELKSLAALARDQGDERFSANLLKSARGAE